MPTLLNEKGIRFFFYSNENNEPIHVHMTKGGAAGKVWLEPSVLSVWFNGFSTGEQKEILEIIEHNKETFKARWNEYFSK